MSALADDPNHFVQFCQNIDPAFNSAPLFQDGSPAITWNSAAAGD